MKQTKLIQLRQLLQTKPCLDCILAICCEEEYLKIVDRLYFCKNYTIKDFIILKQDGDKQNGK